MQVSSLFPGILLSAAILLSPLFSQKTIAGTQTQKEQIESSPGEKTGNQSKEAGKTTEETLEALLKKELENTAADNNEPQEKKQEQVSWVWLIFKTFLVLFVLIAFFWLGWKLYIFKKQLLVPKSKVMRLLYRYNLAAGRELQIVQLGENLLVLGVSDSGIQLITEVSDRNTIDQIKLDCEKENAHEKPDFLWELTRIIKEKVSDWTSPQKSLNKNISVPAAEDWSQLRKDSKEKLENLKAKKSFFSHDWGGNEL